jgi:hypothetical protein
MTRDPKQGISRRQAFALSGALTATVISAAVAVAGLLHNGAPATSPSPARPHVVHLEAPAQSPLPVHETEEVD